MELPDDRSSGRSPARSSRAALRPGDRPVQVELSWPRQRSDELATAVHAVVFDVVSSGGAVGWTTPPDRLATDAWLDRLLAEGGALVVARVDGRLSGLGTWSRLPAEVLAHNGEIRRVMVHRSARGLGLGRLITTALIEDARRAGVEHLLCDVRGNNHAAVALYGSLGFREYGRLPDFLAVGRHRFDRVRMYLPLQMAPDVVRHGSRAEGPGASVIREAAPGRRVAAREVTPRRDSVEATGPRNGLARETPVGPEGPGTAIAT